jgi:hypothetical protein
MKNITDIVDTYIASWNETDPERRRALVGQTWSEDGSYLDPMMSGDGPDQISAMIAAAQQQFPGHRFALAAGPDAHHDRVRFTWNLVGSEGPVAVGGDFATVAPDGRLRAVTGFLESA